VLEHGVKVRFARKFSSFQTAFHCRSPQIYRVDVHRQRDIVRQGK
jgi:hypothetical protein